MDDRANGRPHQWLTGESHDNALAESIIGLFKAEIINFLGPWTSMARVERETLHRVSWYNTERLHSALGRRPPAAAGSGG